ncbi:MAG: hypothetical protein HQL46_14930 [Gammaproteobacteria bacterium]|nr:hypothetical protein [Gammaproteobacteria bacterium]
MAMFYLHGFGSRFDKQNQKIIDLSVLGEISGFNIDYSKTEEEIINDVSNQLQNKDVDLLIGTSMGGWLASILSAELLLPFVAFNPVISPYKTLKQYIGRHQDYYGNHYHLLEKSLRQFRTIATNGCGLIFLDEADEVINAKFSKTYLDEHYHVILYSGGSHRFEHVPESIDEIDKFKIEGCLSWGLLSD